MKTYLVYIDTTDVQNVKAAYIPWDHKDRQCLQIIDGDNPLKIPYLGAGFSEVEALGLVRRLNEDLHLEQRCNQAGICRRVPVHNGQVIGIFMQQFSQHPQQHLAA